jgi:hypothetical protein
MHQQDTRHGFAARDDMRLNALLAALACHHLARFRAAVPSITMLGMKSPAKIKKPRLESNRGFAFVCYKLFDLPRHSPKGEGGSSESGQNPFG